jgi:hypothetical protein
MTAASIPARNARASRISRRAGGRIVTGLGVAFLIFDTVVKFTTVDAVANANAQLGFPSGYIAGVGVLEAICLAIYLIPRTSIVGAVIFTGYLGGAIALHTRVGNPLFSHVLFPVYIATLLWLGLYLRDARLRAIATLALKAPGASGGDARLG